MEKIKLLGVLLLAATVSGCIKNDIPYPRLQGNITAFEVEGQLSAAVIDSAALTVTVDMADTVDLAQVRLLKFALSDKAVAEPAADSGDVLDMTASLEYSLATWPGQQYLWTVTATQTIERYVRAENQVGEAVISASTFSVKLPISEDVPLDEIVITEVQLGPSNSVITPDPREVHDFTQPQKFTVTYRDITEEWTIAVMPTEVTVTTSDADAWAHFAYLYGMVPSGAETPTFRYVEAGGSEWLDVPAEDVTVDGMNVSALLRGLSPGTDYVYKIVSGDLEGSEVAFTTEEAAQMPNMGFDQWVKDGKSWYANPDLESGYWWDSGNYGANMIGEANPTSPEEVFLAVSGDGERAARLESVKVAIKMAGGNVFSGHFGSVQGLGAEVFFGRPFESRPLTLSGYYSYSPVPIDNVDPPDGVELPFDASAIAGQSDRCHIFVYVTAWDGPYRVNTTEHRYLDVNDPDVLGYGELIDEVGTGGEYKPFTINIKYREDKRNVKPTYCAVVAVASQYADYFTGGIGSLMYVDEFSFGYDGDVIWE
ncbi:MAG TPA: PCMD domain-containing protein [Candidatus Coprenecus stercorigallinarum]|nr:PCMD domain-containing protein [Candidatus Coprenecus stercorigallinarum]